MCDGASLVMVKLVVTYNPPWLIRNQILKKRIKVHKKKKKELDPLHNTIKYEGGTS